MTDSAAGDYPDETVGDLARLFYEHPAWCRAAEWISQQSESDVRFSHRPGEAWHLARQEGRSVLRSGACADPDFAFRFSPGSVRRLADVRGDIGDFAVALFASFDEDDPDLRIDFRVVAAPGRLVRRGHLRLLLSAGPKVLAFGATRGVRSWRALRALIEQSRASAPEWD